MRKSHLALTVSLGAVILIIGGVVLRLHQVGRTDPVAAFAVPNPAPGPHPTWTPQPLPITRRNGDLAVTLTEVTTGVLGSEGEMVSTRATFRLSQRGRPTDEWEPVESVITDATGNTYNGPRWSYSSHEGQAIVQVAGGLPTSEAAWKLRFGFARTATARFAANEAVTVRHVATPRSKQFIPADRTAMLQGTTIQVLGIAGPGLNDGSSWYGAYRRPTVRVQLSAHADHRLTLRAVDDRGREVFASADDPQTSHRGSEYHFPLTLPQDTRSLDLTFAIDRIRYVEFLAKPAVL
jgi:hypothetical protein